MARGSFGKRAVPVFEGMCDETGRLMMRTVDKPARDRHYRSLAGKRVAVRVSEWKDVRSEQANAYYWSCVLEPAAEEFSATDQTAEDLHDYFAERFLPNEKKRVEFFNKMTGQRLAGECSDRRRTSKLTGEPFYVYVEKVRKALLEEMSFSTEDPDPLYWRKRQKAVERAVVVELEPLERSA